MCIGSLSLGVFSLELELLELEELLEPEELEELELVPELEELELELVPELDALPSSAGVVFEQALNRATSIRTATSRATILFVVIFIDPP